ncbi:unnamed protein product [Darwinula stevensoni]|uniref:Uncharacterized protein n=1 Tax=Darwinula stevensoni TaxID=69355 RepID=A0A7R9ACZ8_9CRUS|nr:unnamed protein product [Darwinula stevensoni]CAG0900285.1 unnamed protein product [Darwinula stevensoni]
MDAFGLVLLALAGSAGSVSSATGGGPTSRWTAGPRQDEGLAVELHEGGDYAILVNGQYWLQNAATYFNVDGTLYSTADGTLALTDGPVEGSGSDALGPYRLFTWTWAAGAAAIETSVAVYDDSPSLVFGQKFLSAVAGTSLGDPNGVVSSFPSFQVQDGLPEKGFLSIYGRFLGQKRVTIAK